MTTTNLSCTIIYFDDQLVSEYFTWNYIDTGIQQSPVMLFGVGVGGTAVFSLLTPLAAGFNIWGVFAVRFTMGLLSGKFSI